MRSASRRIVDVVAPTSFIAALVLASVAWSLTHPVVRGGAYRIEVAGSPVEGRFYALFVSTHPPRTLTDLAVSAGVTTSDLAPVVDRRSQFDPAVPSSDNTSASRAADHAWVAANRLARSPVRYGVRRVVPPDERPGNSASAGSTGGFEYRFDTPRPLLELRPGLNGPSLGLAAALVYLDALGAGDLSGGLVVAATGTIDVDGTVVTISGVRHKTHAASAVAADVLFVPTGNLAAATTVGDLRPTMTLVPVDDLADAVAWLCEHGADDASCPPPLSP